MEAVKRLSVANLVSGLMFGLHCDRIARDLFPFLWPAVYKDGRPLKSKRQILQILNFTFRSDVVFYLSPACPGGFRAYPENTGLKSGIHLGCVRRLLIHRDPGMQPSLLWRLRFLN